jgi:ubiquinone/menaquinone biosynthesis C-methylase UbiE
MSNSSREYFADIAQRWDSISAEFFSETVRDKAIDLARVRRGLVAADVGAGTGFLTGGLLQRGAKVIAVDQSEEMLEEIQSKYGGTYLRCVTGEAETLPLPDASVDRVLANMYLHHVERPPLAVQEIARILRPGGRVVITDLDEHGFEFLRTEQHDGWLGFNREQIEAWFDAAGLDNIVVEDLGEKCSSGSETSQEKAAVSIFAAHADWIGI